MTVKTVAELKQKFEAGDTPTAQDFIDLCDSYLHAQYGNFPNPLPAVSAINLLDVGSALPNPLPARDGAALYNINPLEYNVPGSMPVPSLASSVSFVVAGDWTASATDPDDRILLPTRRIRLTFAGVFMYSEIVSAVFSSGISTVTVADTMPAGPIEAFAAGVITPISYGGSVGQSMIGLGRGAAIAAAATLDIGASGSLFHVTGSTGPITAISARPPGQDLTLVFDGAPAMTHNPVTLILPGGVNQQLVAGDVMQLTSEGVGLWRCVALNGATGHKPANKDHGTKSASYTLQLDEADMHVIAFSAAATLTIASRRATDRALVVVKNGGFTITLAGIDNDPPTALTVGASKQDYLGLAKSFGKIGCLSFVLNRATA